MTDAAPADPRPVQGAPSRPSLLAPSDRMKRRNAAEARFRAYGLIAISTAGALLVVLLWNILAAGLPAFQRTVVTVDFTLTEDQFDAAESVLFKTREYETYFIAALSDQLRDRGLDLEFDSASVERLLGKVGATLRSHYRDNPDAIGQPVRFELPTSSRVERYFKGGFARADIGDANRFITAGDLDLADALKQAGVLRTAFNWTFVTGVDTGSDNPGGAGIGASVVGSFYMMLVVLSWRCPSAWRPRSTSRSSRRRTGSPISSR
jgi:phosphate transport system permease protein